MDTRPTATLPEIDTHTDTREYLRHSRAHAEARGYSDWTIVDADAHHVESISWKEIVDYIDDPVLRDQAQRFHAERVGSPPYGLVGDFGLRYQDAGGRIPHQSDQREKIDAPPGYPSRRGPDPARHGGSGRGLDGRLPDLDAVSRDAPPAADGGSAGPRL